MLGFRLEKGVSNGNAAGNPDWVQDAWSEQPYPHLEVVLGMPQYSLTSVVKKVVNPLLVWSVMKQIVGLPLYHPVMSDWSIAYTCTCLDA
jgi:hypothetical protein